MAVMTSKMFMQIEGEIYHAYNFRFSRVRLHVTFTSLRVSTVVGLLKRPTIPPRHQYQHIGTLAHNTSAILVAMLLTTEFKVIDYCPRYNTPSQHELKSHFNNQRETQKRAWCLNFFIMALSKWRHSITCSAVFIIG